MPGFCYCLQLRAKSCARKASISAARARAIVKNPVKQDSNTATIASVKWEFTQFPPVAAQWQSSRFLSLIWHWETAQKYLALGFYIGITGMVTFPKLKDVAEIAAKCPSDRLLIETDGPYLAPVPLTADIA